MTCGGWGSGDDAATFEADCVVCAEVDFVVFFPVERACLLAGFVTGAPFGPKNFTGVLFPSASVLFPFNWTGDLISREPLLTCISNAGTSMTHLF